MSLWTVITVGVRIIGETFDVESGIGGLAFSSYSGYGHQGFDAKLICSTELAPGIVAFVVEGGKGVGSQYDLCLSEHGPHGLFVVPVGDSVVNDNLVFVVH